MKNFLLLLGALLSFGAAARPAWVDSAPPADQRYKYYVGRSSNSPTESAGFAEATREAYEQAIRENFGFRTRIDSQSYTTTQESAATKRIRELSENVEIHDFEQAGSFIEKVSADRLNVWALFRYSRAAIEKEKARLASRKPTTDQEAFSDVGTASPSATKIEITSEPPGASVTIDGTPAGLLRTPVRLLGTVEPGRHRIQIDHPQYQSVDEDFIALPGNTVRIHRTLVKAQGKLGVITTPPTASIFINGKPVGVSPTDPVPVPAGVAVLVEVTHAGAERLVQEVTVGRDETEFLRLQLPLKPSFLSVTSQPVGADVYVDGEKIGTTPLASKKLAAGAHALVVKKPGYEPAELEFSTSGGEKKALSIKLSKTAPGEVVGDTRTVIDALWGHRNVPEDEVTAHRGEPASSPWLTFGLGAALQSDFVPGSALSPLPSFGLTTRLRFLGGDDFAVGLEGGADYFFRTNRGLDRRVSGARLMFGVPVFVGRHFFIGPQLLYVSRRETDTSALGGVENRSMTAFGGAVGAQLWFSPESRDPIAWGGNAALGVHRFSSMNTIVVSFRVTLTLGVR